MKTKILCQILCVTLSVGLSTTAGAQTTNTYTQAVLADHPVVFYQFEENTGAVVAADSSGATNNGTYNDVSLDNASATTNLGYAVGFSGSSSSDVAVPPLASAYSLGGSGNDQFTIEAWINPAQLSGADSIYTVDQWNPGIVHFLVLGTPGTNGISIRFTVADSVNANGSQNDANFPSSSAITVGYWAYVAVVYDDTVPSATLYINGEPIATNIYSTTYPISLDSGAIGVQTDGGDLPFTGLIDEFAIYTNALSAARIQAHYAAAGTVLANPTILITSQPQDTLAAVGSRATFTTGVTITGTTNSPSYQWQTNRVNIAGATNATYTTPVLALADNGTHYDCVVTVPGTLPATTHSALLTVKAAPMQSYANTVKADNPVVFYQFEESPGATLAVDSSGANNNGTYNDVSLNNTSGSTNLGYAAGFSGSSSSDVAVPPLGSAIYSLGGSGNEQVTIEAWIDPAQLSGADAIYTVNQWNTGIVHLLVNGSSIRFTVATPPYDVNFPSSPAIAVGKWAYVAVVYDETVPSATLYINGEPVSTNVYTTTMVPVSLDNASIGVQMDGGDPPFTGLIDEFAIYTNALSADRIAEHYLAAGTVATGGTIFIIGQPQDALGVTGGTTTFKTTATALGTTNLPIYQWQTNGVNITGATNATYTTPVLTLGDNGTHYDCVVTLAGALPTSTRSALLTVMAAPGMSYADSVKADNPVVYYRFEESPGATVAADSSGAGNNGSYTNISLGNPSAAAMLGYSAGFSGSSSSYVAVPPLGSAIYSLGGSGNNQVTVEAWIDPAQLSGADSIYTVDTYNTGILHFLVNGSSIRFSVANNTPNDVNFPSSPAIAIGQWAYLAVVYNDTVSNATLYINGEPVSTNIYTMAGPVSLDTAAIGVQTDGGDPPYSGLIDEFAIYTNALSAARVQEHYLAALAPLPSLSISKSGGGVTVSWNTTGFILQETTNSLNNASWLDIPNATNSPVTVPIGTSSSFYRLRSQ